VIAHIVLFRPRADLRPEDRQRVAAALERARRDIPSIRRFHLGRRVRHGRPYELGMREDFPYVALAEFDDVGGLRTYLDHPAHEALGQLWASTSDATLVYDYETTEAQAGFRFQDFIDPES
jgi:hypothetical protein